TGRLRSPAAAVGQGVTFEDFREELSLTEAFQELETFFGHLQSEAATRNFVTCEHVVGKGLRGCNAIVIRLFLDKWKIVCCLCSLLIISPVVGIAIGLASHRADVGVAASTVLIAIASLLQGVAAWFQR
ncbi:MAG: hypothetical protein Q9205_007765, partial [Flavoplaca limonia]